ncbi:MAG: MFS transporter [Chromatiales bacterium]|jgi:MFS family permease|nr:MFS transporter [Chromatiales bacterium]
MPDKPHRLGPIELANGILPLHAGSFLFAAFISISLTTFISVIQPYVLTVQIGLAVDQQGQVSGDMMFYSEVIVLALSAAVGVLSDRLGRRGIFAVGALILGIGYGLYGMVDSVTTLTATRIFLAFGIAIVNVLVQAVQADYPAESSRGKLVGLTGFAIGIGAVLIGVVFSRLPYWYVDAGMSELAAGRNTMFTMAGLALFLAVLVRLGLKGGRPPQPGRPTSFARSMIQGLRAGRQNPLIALAYGSAFVARADLVVVGTFFTLWLNQTAIAAGMNPEDAMRAAGGFFALAMSSALIWAPIAGFINDRLDRTRAMALAMFLCAIGYSVMGLIPDPLGGWMYPAAVLLGIGQMSAITASQTLIGQEASAVNRGSIIGMFSFFGAAGVMFITSVGGRIFDSISPAAPFVLVGFINVLLFIAAILISRLPDQQQVTV